MEGPPTKIMYSPDGGDAACDANAKIDTAQMSKSGFIIQRQETIYAGRKILQIGVGAAVLSRNPRTSAREYTRLYSHCGSISPRIRSSFFCRGRIRANLSPRTSASAGNGLEL